MVSRTSAWVLAVVAGLVVSGGARASDCSKTSKGYIPLMDLGSGTYQGFEGGLYPGGTNSPPTAHFAAGLRQSTQIKRLGPDGNPSATGKIVLISIGMSNTTQEFSYFKPIADADPRKNPSLVIVDCAQGGKTAPIWADPTNAVWTTADQRLQAAGVTPNQVQVVWSKQAISNPNKAFPADAQELQGYLKTIARNVKSHYPNTRIIYLASRIYAGYASTTLNPEPYAYQSGFAVKWLIKEQMDGSADLNFDPAKGAVRAPWLAWGPYLWADGLVPRSDGLIYECSDLQSDGTHPNTGARQKVSNLLLSFLKTDKTAAPWFAITTASQAKLASDGATVNLYGKAVVMGTGPIPGAIYVEEPDASSGIRVQGAAAEGGFVNVTGTMQTSSDGERYISASSVSPAASGVFPAPAGMTNREIGGEDLGIPPSGQKGTPGSAGVNNIGLLVNAWGRSAPVDSASFTIADGSNVDVKVVVPSGVQVPDAIARPYVVVTGISSLWKDGNDVLHRAIRVRRQGDIVELP